MSYTFKTYRVNGRAYFVSGETRIVKKDLPASDDLMNLLDLDLAQLEATCSSISKALQRLYLEKDPRLAKQIGANLMVLSKMHIYFEFLRLDWRDRLTRAEEAGFDGAHDMLPEKQISHIPVNISGIQRQLREIIQQTLDIDATRGTSGTAAERLFQFQQKMKRDPRRNSSLEFFRFDTLSLRYEATEQGTFAEVLYPQSIYDLIDYALRQSVMEEQPWRVCKHCGRYFPIHGRTSAEYCDRLITGSGSTCREVGSTKTWEAKMNGDQSFQIYRREYKRRFAWIRLNRWTQEQFADWSAQAQQKRAECTSGKISLEEFAAWLKQ